MSRFAKILCCMTVALGSGCTLVNNTAKNFVNEPRLRATDVQQRRKAEALGWKAWQETRIRFPSESEDFAAGYQDGYADYLLEGRTTSVPPVPPRRYQRIAFHTPASLRAIDEYFNGFHHGANDAQASGNRQLMVVPVAICGPAEPSMPLLTGPPPAAILPPKAEAPTELLPRPRELGDR